MKHVNYEISSCGAEICTIKTDHLRSRTEWERESVPLPILQRKYRLPSLIFVIKLSRVARDGGRRAGSERGWCPTAPSKSEWFEGVFILI